MDYNYGQGWRKNIKSPYRILSAKNNVLAIIKRAKDYGQK